MKQLRLNNVDLEKDQLMDKINFLLQGCNKSVDNCKFGYCRYYGNCMKEVYSKDGLPNKRRPLIRLLKSLQSSIRKINGKRSPHSDGNTPIERAEYCIGQPIFEHELIKGCDWAIAAIKKCTTLNKIVEIFDRRHVDLYGKSKIWHYNYKNRK